MSDQNHEYQKTLNLPVTDFAMKANLALREPLLLEKWEKANLYSKIRAKSKGQPKFILHDGPPYANGNIHIGHALNKILKDFIVKYKTMKGFDSHYVPGWDCHGLPIEHQLLKELKKRKSDVDCVEFRKSAHDYAMKYVGIQRDEFKRLGVFGDWEDPYLTLNPEYEYWILKSLGTLNKKGYVYRGLKPVNWCFSCETALAEAEVEYEDHTSQSVYVKFEVTNANVLKDLSNKKVSLLIWTTTPWTLVANVAVAVHREFTYVAVDIGDEILIVEKNLSVSVLDKGQITHFKILKEFSGRELKALTYHHPLSSKKDCPVVTADYVTKEDGTGLVHTAPGHGQDDFQTGQKYNLEVLMPVNNQGVYTAEAGQWAGEHVFKANEKIIAHLKDKGVLFLHQPFQHTYPHCWRCKNPIIFRATKQWFLNVDHDNLRSKLKEVIHQSVQWIPPAGEERILGMVLGRPDWCLSRQRYWGVPIPAVECKGCGGEYKLFPEVVDAFAELVKTHGTNAWFEKDIKDIVPKGFVCPTCKKSDFEKTKDILDVWFDSGVSHQAVVKARMGGTLPADLYLEGSDQHRGWFQSSLIPAYAMEGKAPFKAVLTHGFVVDGQGRKMSKSLGNVIAPQNIIKQSGADILRLWVASSSYNEDIRVSNEILERLVDAYRKIRNTVRYLLGNLSGFDPDRDRVEYARLLELDQWALYRLARVFETIETHFEKYEFADAFKGVYTFCNEDLSSFYLDILKDRLYTSSAQGLERRSAQTVLYTILNFLARALAPLMSFTSEEIFQSIPKDQSIKDVESVHLLSWPITPDAWENENINQRFAGLVSLRPFVLKALEDVRRSGQIGSSLEAKVTINTESQKDFDYLKSNLELLPATFIVSQVFLNRVEKITKGLGDEFPKTEVVIDRADGEKCGRCWNYKIDVGQDHGHKMLCARCASIVKGV